MKGRSTLASLAQTDPTLARTVMVSTKLDTRIPQFARGQDVDLFLHPPGRQLEPSMLGGSPFFTCAPVKTLAPLQTLVVFALSTTLETLSKASGVAAGRHWPT